MIDTMEIKIAQMTRGIEIKIVQMTRGIEIKIAQMTTRNGDQNSSNDHEEWRSK